MTSSTYEASATTCNDEDRDVSFVITLFEKEGGPLTKRIALDGDGKPQSDGSRCKMSRGSMRRLRLTVSGLALHYDKLKPNQALGYGQMRADIPDDAILRPKRSAEATQPGFYTRTRDCVDYRPGEPAAMLIDHDSGSMSDEVRARIAAAGGVIAALERYIPGLSEAARVYRGSTSSGLYNAETEVEYPGSDGFHLTVVVADGGDTKRTLYTLQERLWAVGLGWHKISKCGSLLERSLIDKMVYDGPRLIFEGPPELIPPLKQRSREARVWEGSALDTRVAIPDMTPIEQANAERNKTASAEKLRDKAAAVRAAWLAARAEAMKGAGKSESDAKRAAEQWANGVLTPSVTLIFDDDDIGKKTVADVLDDPTRYVGATLADPIESSDGVNFEPNKAVVLLDEIIGDPFIYSFKHGGFKYFLRYDRAYIEATLAVTLNDAVIDTLCRMIHVGGDDCAVSPSDLTALINVAAKRSGEGKRDVSRRVAEAIKAKREQMKQAKKATTLAKEQRFKIEKGASDDEIGPMLFDCHSACRIARRQGAIEQWS